jgi:lycopene cyclase domain-containing protein
MPALSYIFLDLAVLLGAFILTLRHPIWGEIWSVWFLRRAIILFVTWSVVDWISVYLRLWQFPSGGTLPIRIVGLPLEEYAVFVVHTVLTYSTVRLMKNK